MSDVILEMAMGHALALAWEVAGKTAPNPPVGAVALNAAGEVLASAAHQGAGQPHGEAAVLNQLKAQGQLAELHTMVVTLEPCNHQGRTPPCSKSLIAAGVKRVAYGSADPNPKAAGGHQRLIEAGVEVVSGVLQAQCDALNAPFLKRVTTGLPFVAVKRAWRPDGQGGWTMVPEAGQKTFTRPDSLKLAHEMRKRADAIITGSGTVLIDDPSFTVRHIPDHADFASGARKRILVLFDRQRRVPASWIDKASANFEIEYADCLETALRDLASRGGLHVLVEAGPTLSQAVIDADLADQVVDIKSTPEADLISVDEIWCPKTAT